MQRTINPDRWVEYVEREKKRMSAEHAALVDIYLEHIRSERSGDIDRVMAHMTEDVEFRRFGAVGKMAQTLDYQSLRELFTQYFSAGWPEFELEPERLVVDGDALVIDGVMWCIAGAASLNQRNVSLPEGSGDQKFLASYRLAAFFQFRDGKMCREDTYRGSTTVVPLEGSAGT